MDQLSLQNVLLSAQMAAPHPSRLVAVREATFHQLAPSPQYTLAVLAPASLSILVHQLLLLPFALPVPPPFLFLLRNISSHFVTLHPLQHRPAVVAAVGNQLFNSLQVHFRFLLRPLLRLVFD